MRRLPHIVSFLLFIALCASAAYWAMQLFKPPVRPVAVPPRVAQEEIRPDAAATLFGSRKGSAAVASNYQLRGVIFSGNPRDSVAIISADGKPPQAIRADREVVPGVTIKEVHRDHVLLSEGGVTKRVDLPESAKGLAGIAEAPVATRPVTPPAPTQPIPSRAPSAAAAQQQVVPAVPSLPAGQPVPPVQPAPAVPGVPPVSTTPGMPLTPQTAPSPAQPSNQPVPGQIPGAPTVTTAPPTTVVSPAPGTPGATPAVPVPKSSPGTQAVPGTPQVPAR